MKRILVIAAHCDDETFGCAGLMRAAHDRGDNVVVLMATEIKDTRKELEEACNIIGVDTCIPLGLRALTLEHYIPVLSDAIRNVVFDQEINYVFTQARTDTHQDHRAINMATMIACGPMSRIDMLAEYESPLSSAPLESFEPNAFVGINLIEKMRAIECYKSQAMPYPHPRSAEAARDLAHYRGTQCGMVDAEGFRIVRVRL